MRKMMGGISAAFLAASLAVLNGGLLARADSAWLTLGSFSGTPGGSVEVWGGGFDNRESVWITLGNNPSLVGSAPVANGMFGPITVNIPVSTQGPLSVNGTGSVSHKTASNSIYIQPLTSSITSVTGNNTPGSNAFVSGTGFGPFEPVVIALNGMGGTTVPASDASGAISNAQFTIPQLSPGTYQLTATGQHSNAKAIYYFYVNGFYPTAYPLNYYVLPGNQLGFSGSGFAPGENIRLSESVNTLKNFLTDSGGSFADATITVPLAWAGSTKTFKFAGDTSHASTQAMVGVGSFNAQVSPSTYFPMSGEPLAWNGWGFAPGETVQVFAGESQPFATMTADMLGGFQNAGRMNIPFSWSGQNKVFVIKGKLSGTETRLTLTIASFFSQISPSLYFAKSGDVISISGYGFAPNENVSVTAPGNLSLSGISDNFGNLQTGTTTIPFGIGTTLTFTAIGSKTNTPATVAISIGSFNPTVSPSVYYVLPGGSISFSGSGFAPGETVNGTLSGGSIGSFIANQNGNFTSGNIPVPAYASGKLYYSFRGNLSQVDVPISIGVAALSPYLNSDVYFAPPGSVIHVQGFGFAPNETVNVSAGGFSSLVLADKFGDTTSTPVTLPISSGKVNVNFRGAASGASASLAIGVAAFNPQIALSTYYTLPGSPVTVFGYGFLPNETIYLSAGSVNTSTPADAGGNASSTFTVPFGSGTKLTITLRGGTSNAQISAILGLGGYHPWMLLSSYYAAPGSTLVVSGFGFAPNEQINLSVGGNNFQTAADASGNSVSSTTVPFIGGNTLPIFLKGVLSNAQVSTVIGLASFNPWVSPSAWYLWPGSNVTFVGHDFAAGETVAITAGGQAQTPATADSSGGFRTVGITVPTGGGSAHFEFRGNMSQKTVALEIATAQLNPGIQLSSYYGLGGSPLTVFGGGFVAGETVKVNFENSFLGSTLAGLDGSFSLATSTPAMSAGAKLVSARGLSSGGIGNVTFIEAPVVPGAWLGNYAGSPGTPITFIGSGFYANEPITVAFDRGGIAPYSFKADASGSFSNSGFVIPSGLAAGNLTVTISGAYSGSSFPIVFYVGL